ncbi:AI-2E family transporter [Patescibacteria group bacterium]|nr:AI-2E family transporter [Patescibacteria group bacterium]
MTGDFNRTTIEISSGTIIRIILFLILVALLYYLRDLVLIVLTAIVIASAIEPAAKWFMRYRFPRVLAVLVVYIIIVFFFLGLFYFFLPPILDEAAGFLSTLPTYLDSLNSSSSFPGSGFLSPPDGAEPFSLGNYVSELQSSFSNITGGFFKTISVIFGGVFSLLLIIIFSFYFAVQETGIDDFIKVITPVKHQKYAVGLWRRSQHKIGLWMQGQLLLALIIGVLVYLGLTILGVPYAFLLAILAAVAELIPVFGPILAGIPAALIAFIDGGASFMFMVIGLYVIIQQFENYLIYPLVVTKVVGVPPLLVILALIIGAQLAGFLGIILSVPVAAAVQELVNDVRKVKEKIQVEAAEETQ